ncbi:Protein of unknown function (DUF2804) domain containing protein [Naviculisporaceae sp. PSN 640]
MDQYSASWASPTDPTAAMVRTLSQESDAYQYDVQPTSDLYHYHEEYPSYLLEESAGNTECGRSSGPGYPTQDNFSFDTCTVQTAGTNLESQALPSECFTPPNTEFKTPEIVPGVGSNGHVKATARRKKRFTCLDPNCKQESFPRQADLDCHNRIVHSIKFHCDYPRCVRADPKHAISRLDHFRDHLRELHKEDLFHRGRRHDEKWWKSHVYARSTVSADWYLTLGVRNIISLAAPGSWQPDSHINPPTLRYCSVLMSVFNSTLSPSGGRTTLCLARLEEHLQPLVTPGAPSDPNIGQPCGMRDVSIPNQNIDCPSPLTCVPQDKSCTRWFRPNDAEWGFFGCPGTCQSISPQSEQIYTKCGNMIYDTDCIEGNERCVGDPRRRDGTPAGDGPGICWPFRDMCGWDSGLTCPEGKVCFGGEKSDNPNLKRGPFCATVMYQGERKNVCGAASFASSEVFHIMSKQADPSSENGKNDAQYRLISENELVDPSNLSLSLVETDQPTINVNPSAHGWSRRPLGDTRLYSGLGAFMRNKRWEYYGIMTPRHVIGITISSLDYAGVNQLFILDREYNTPLVKEAIAPLARGVNLPDTYDPDTTASFESKDLSIRIVESRSESDRITSITVTTTSSAGQQQGKDEGKAGISLDLTLTRPITSDALHVVVPWNSKQFQYTIKEPAIPCSGTLTIDGIVHTIDSPSAFAVLDHGRGRWPYRMVWNWAAGSGISPTTGKRIGLQLGAKWTEGTGSTENAIIVDGKLIKISEELTWEYDTEDWMKPWRITGKDLEATFTPFYERVAKTSLVILSSETHQLFGRWEGVFKLGGDAGAEVLSLDGLEGWAEEARNCW